jgi:hypothetical protein
MPITDNRTGCCFDTAVCIFAKIFQYNSGFVAGYTDNVKTAAPPRLRRS